MRRPKLVLLGIIAVIAPSMLIISSVAGTAVDRASAPGCGQWMSPDQTPTARAAELLSAMTLTEKLSLVHQELGDAFGSYGAAGYVLGIPALCIPPLVLNDAGSGLADEQVAATAYPTAISQASMWDPALEQRLGASLGEEAHAKGIDVLLGPDLNLTRTPLGGRTSEQFGEDPYLTAQTGVAFIQGVQSAHVIASAKHFDANDQEVDRASINEVIDQRTLEELYEAPFDAAVNQGHVGSVMCAYNQVNGAYSCQNPALLYGDLEEQYGFQGFTVSDWGATHSTAASANAGLDLEMGTVQIPDALVGLTGPSLSPGGTEVAEDWYGAPLLAAIKDGQVSIGVLNDMVARILHAMFATGVFDDPPASLPTVFLAGVDTPANQSVALAAAEAGTVLLKDNAGVLPLGGPGLHIAVIGLDASVGAELVDQAGGSVRGTQTNVVTPLAAITARALRAGDTVLYDPGASTETAAAIARTADVAIVYGGYTEGEGADLSNLGYNNAYCELQCVTLPANTDDLVSAVAAANPHTVVMLNTGGPVEMPWLNQVQGVLENWYPGEEDGAAAASILFGDTDPSGKLPVTFPASLAQLPTQSASQYPGVNGTMTYSEGLLIGYRWYDAEKLAPLFPFGFGLSYTNFALSGLSERSSGNGPVVSATLTNTGSRQGADVVQVYVSDPPSAGEPPQQLVSFSKTSLQPGQSSPVSFTLGSRAFAHWDTQSHAWKVTPGCYTIHVGDSSKNEPLAMRLAVDGGSCS